MWEMLEVERLVSWFRVVWLSLWRVWVDLIFLWVICWELGIKSVLNVRCKWRYVIVEFMLVMNLKVEDVFWLVMECCIR